ncbi:DUF397 domain-containing protein [Nonomuraea sp. NPDC002799]
MKCTPLGSGRGESRPSGICWAPHGGNGCVEVTRADVAPGSAPHKANRGPLVLFRDSENPEGAVLAFTRGELQAFFAGVKAG